LIDLSIDSLIEHKISLWQPTHLYFRCRFWNVASSADPNCTRLPNFSTVGRCTSELK